MSDTRTSYGLLNQARIARLWHAVTLIAVILSVATQLTLTINNVDVGFGSSEVATGERVVRFFSYFTIQSNLLVGITAAMLMVRPGRDGLTYRVLRIAALFGITVTLIIYQVVLSPLAAFTGIAAVSNVGLHYVVPSLAIIGWVLVGPHPRVSWKALWLALVWPALYVIYTAIHGVISGFYPYPFIDLSVLDLSTVARNGAGVMLLLLAVGSVYKALDGVLARHRRTSNR